MNSQPKWDIYESVVLLNGYLLACKKSEPRAYIIRRVSADLRAMAIHRGRKIDEIFRNENGISYQMQSMDSAYKGRKIYVPATKLFQETVSLYRNQNSRFQELLKEARYMIEHDIAHPALNDTDVFVVDFNDCPDMSFARVSSLTYRGQAIEEDITENNFSKLGSIDVYESECMNPGINASALQTLLFDRYLSEDYDRKRSIITRKGAEVRVYDVMKEFCLEHEQISVNEIEAYERDISGRFT